MDEEKILSRDIHWSPQLEDLIAQEGEKCRGLAWIHQHSEQLLNNRNNYIQIPAIVLSTLCGTASIGSSSLFGSTEISSVVIGLVSISIGVLNTVGNYFSFAKKSESHRIAYLHYSKLFSWVSIELSLPREERLLPADMLKQLRSEMERLAEMTPVAPERILLEFAERFKNYTNISKPAETNGLSKIIIYRNITTPLNSPLIDKNSTQKDMVLSINDGRR